MNRWRIVLISGLVVLVTALHYITPVNVPALHIVYRELYFVPIILACLWGGKRGGLSTSIAVSVIYIPHVLFLAKPHPSFDPNMMLNILATSVESLRSDIHGEVQGLKIVEAWEGVHSALSFRRGHRERGKD